MGDLPSGWEMRDKPPSLFRRFDFERYADTRGFLDALAALAEETGIHPEKINFGSTYVNITFEAADDAELTEGDYTVAARINDLYRSKAD
ncbi:MAG: 4a-hydroxytetrahydrobiopterin dehydratase [Gammaproteobacteria bacterium]|nr:4a-hydroxytetrahydrobiopterin dehydratase [Gammaproteobacteria bacterium]